MPKLKRQTASTKGRLLGLGEGDEDVKSPPVSPKAGDPPNMNTVAGQPNSEDQSEKKDAKKKDGKEKFECKIC